MPFDNQDVTLTVPEGAGPGEVRIFLATEELPPPLDTYLYNNQSPVKAAIIFFHGLSIEDDYAFLGLIEDIAVSPSNLILQLGHVKAGVVREEAGLFPKGQLWYLDQTDDTVKNISRADIDIFNEVAARNFLSMVPVGLGTTWFVDDNGDMWWGSGVGSLDVSIRRSAANILEVRHDLWVTGPASDGVHFSEDFDNIDTTSNDFTAIGSVNFCAVRFTAPPSGRGTLLFNVLGDSNNSTPVGAQISPEVREGAIFGSGTVVQSPTSIYSCTVGTGGEPDDSGSGWMHVEGLTPKEQYNAVLMHRRANAAGTAQIFHRTLKWLPDLG